MNEILDATEDMQLVYSMLTEKCFNKKEVIDIIAYCDLQIILNSEKVGRIVYNFWEGHFETEFFMNNCYAYQQCYKMFIDSKRFFGYKPKQRYIFSIENLYKRMTEKEFYELGEKEKLRKAHFFHFKRWDQSLMTKYIIEALFIVIGTLWTSQIAIQILDINAEITPLLNPALALIEQLNNNSLTSAQQVELGAQVEIINAKTGEFFRTINYSVIVRVYSILFLCSLVIIILTYS